MKKLWIITFTLLFITACRPDIIKVKQADKQTVFPGRKEAPVFLRYNVSFELLKPVQLKSIYLVNGEKTLHIDRFLLKNLDIKKPFNLHQTLPVGTYVFETRKIKDDVIDNKEDYLVFTVRLSGDKTYDYKVVLQQGKNIYMP